MTRALMPEHFLWGVASSGHQTDGGDDAADTTFVEHIQPTVFVEPAGSACGSWERWRDDLDLISAMGLNAFRFSMEWARVEPSRGEIDEAALARYDALVDECVARGIAPVVTLSHFTAPHWFAREGSWLHPDAADWFAGFARVVTERYGDRVAMIVTLNEPNLPRQLAGGFLPTEAWTAIADMLSAASSAAGVAQYRLGNLQRLDELDAFEAALERAHIAARAAVRQVRPGLPVGLSLAVADEVAIAGGEGGRDHAREVNYGRWLRLAQEDDFIGVQNYEQIVHGPDGWVEPPPHIERNAGGMAIVPESLAGAVRYCHSIAGVPVLVSEHGLAAEDDTQRCRFIPAALACLDDIMAEGVPVVGYCHWTLLDNFEWIFGFERRFGLHEVDRDTLARTPKASSRVLAAEVARRMVRR